MLIFKGLRFPAAHITKRHRAAIPLPDGKLIRERNYVTITTAGRGRLWVPEPVDATWRSFAELDLGGDDSEDFVRRRGDPVDPNYRNFLIPEELVRRRADLEQPSRQINTMRWFHLASALRVATENWLAPDGDGVSHPRVKKSGPPDRRLFTHQAALDTLLQTNLVPAREGNFQVLAHKALTLAAFMVLRAAQALEEQRPMKKCLQCSFWFEIRREQREPRFCSNSCRSLHHQQAE